MNTCVVPCTIKIQTIEHQSKASLIIVFYPEEHNEVQCDASYFVVGAALMQHDMMNGTYKSAEYLYKSLNVVEYDYSAIEHKFFGQI